MNAPRKQEHDVIAEYVIVMRNQEFPEDGPIFYSEPIEGDGEARVQMNRMQEIFPLEYEIWKIPTWNLRFCPKCLRKGWMEYGDGKFIHVHNDQVECSR